MDYDNIHNYIKKYKVNKKDLDYLIKYKNYEDIKDLKCDIRKVSKNYPLQHIVGNTEFYGYVFQVNNKVLIPRVETELLVEKTSNYIKQYFNKDNIKIADICAGSGCIGITLKNQFKKSDVVCVEKYAKAYNILDTNNQNFGNIVNTLKGDLLKPLKKEKFDLIISNPPYISYDETVDKQVSMYEPVTALYAPDNGLYFYEEILKKVSKNLKDKSMIAFEIGMKQGKELKKIANNYFKNSKIIIEKDYNKRDRFLFIFNNLV